MARARPRTSERENAARQWIRALREPRSWALIGAFFIALAIGGAWGSWLNLCAGDACPSIAQIQTFEHEQTTKLFAHDGRALGELGFERRTPVSINAVPDYVPQAVIAIEDGRFYEHGGFDPRGIARAAFGVLTFRNLGGGSTITQQLARNMFDEIGFERRYLRKLRELQVALDLEQAYTKDQILEGYLNEVYMGRGYGFQNAARNYFGKNLADVNVAEAALLAAILNRPGQYDPFRYPDRAKSRRDLVLTRMAEEEYLTADEAARWEEWPLPDEEPSGTPETVAPYFEEWVRQILDSRFGDAIYRNGFRVHTTLDAEMQRAARLTMDEGWAAIEADSTNFQHPHYSEFDTVSSFPGSTPYLQGSFIAMDPTTGHVRALIGGRDFDQSRFDRARQARRQAGSAFKPFVYTAAIASGIPASHIVVDGPVVYPQIEGEDWRPSNFTQEFEGPMTIREGLYRSKNMIAIKLGWEEVGIETVAQTARRMGIQTDIGRLPSTTIGASSVIPLQMAEAYATFPNLGTKVRPFPILRVEDRNGNVIWEPQPERTEVLDSLSSRIMVSMLEDVVVRGTAYNAIRVRAGLSRDVPAAGKTGTTNDGTDVWFMGFTPNLVASVWFGMDTPAPIFRKEGGTREATGGGLAAPVWGSFMKRVYEGMETDADAGAEGFSPLLATPEPWPMPDGLNAVLVDRETGQLASRWCDEEDQYLEYYVPGTEPTEFCDRSNRRFRIPGRPGR